MKAYYFSYLISENTFKSIYKKKLKPGIQAQVFNRLIVEGLINNGIDVTCISTIPTSKALFKETFIKAKNDGYFKYFEIINIPVIKDLYIFIKAYYQIKKLLKENSKAICILDILCPTSSLAATIVCKKLNKQCIGIVTDIPKLISNNKLYLKMTEKIINNCSDYVFLTEDMNKYLNSKNKPYCVIEGISKNIIINKNIHRQKIFMYAGSLDVINGIDKLVKAFKKIDTNYELHIYGAGDYENEIIKTCKSHKNIKFFGLVTHKEILNKITTVSFLINPRGVDNEMVKYSFPSKTMEYLASGTPFLCTKLPCLPDEYFNYLNIFENDQIDGIQKGIEDILKKDYSLLLEKAKNGQKFILENKNSTIQTKKIIELIRGQK